MTPRKTNRDRHGGAIGIVAIISLALTFAMSIQGSIASASPAKSVASRQMLSDEVNVYVAFMAFNNMQMTNLSKPITWSNIESHYVELKSAVESFRSSLTAVEWPSSAKTAVKNTVSASSQLANDFQAVSSMTKQKFSSWKSRTYSDLGNWEVQINLANSALGLPSFSHASAVLACDTDVLVLHIAVASFEHNNPGLIPTKSMVLASADGGPYLSVWPTNSHYSLSLSSAAVVLLAVPSGATPTPWEEKPNSCNRVF